MRWCPDGNFLWSPYVIGQTIIFSSCFFFFFLLSSLWSPYVIGQTIIFSSWDFFLLLLLLSFFSSPNLSGRRLDIYHTSTHDVASANLRSRSETSCTRLAGNAGRKNVAKNRHLGTIRQLCRAISSQLRHISTIGKNLLNSYMSSTCPHNIVNFGLLTAEIHPVV